VVYFADSSCAKAIVEKVWNHNLKNIHLVSPDYWCPACLGGSVPIGLREACRTQEGNAL
jgi:hypothetical protein